MDVEIKAALQPATKMEPLETCSWNKHRQLSLYVLETHWKPRVPPIIFQKGSMNT